MFFDKIAGLPDIIRKESGSVIYSDKKCLRIDHSTHKRIRIGHKTTKWPDLEKKSIDLRSCS